MTESDTNPPAEPPEFVRIWFCPRCGSWTGSSGLGDLSQKVNQRSTLRNAHNEDPSEWGKVTGTRAQCQICRAQGLDVDRIPITYFSEPALTRAVHGAIERGLEAAHVQYAKGN